VHAEGLAFPGELGRNGHTGGSVPVQEVGLKKKRDEGCSNETTTTTMTEDDDHESAHHTNTLSSGPPVATRALSGAQAMEGGNRSGSPNTQILFTCPKPRPSDRRWVCFHESVGGGRRRC
jgi:hypothetical protein